MYDCYILVNSTSLTNLKATKPLYPLSCSAVQSLMLIVKYSFKTNNEKNTIECGFYFMFYFEVVTVSGPLSTHWRICQWRWERSAAAVADFRVRRVRPRHRREHTHKKSLFFCFTALVEARSLQQVHGEGTSACVQPGALIGCLSPQKRL